MNQLATQGIILRRTDYGEADRIITLLTSDYGKIRVMAKGVRRQKSKLAGGIELFSISEIHFIKGRGDIDTLVSTRLIKYFGNIVKDYERTEQAYAVLKSINKAVEDHSGSEYFTVVLETLAALDEPKIPLVVAELSVAMRLMQLLGHVPEFSTDNKGNQLQSDDLFSFDYEAVAFKSDDKGVFNKNHLKVLKLLAYNSPQSVAAVQGIGSLCSDLAPLVRSLRLQYVPN